MLLGLARRIDEVHDVVFNLLIEIDRRRDRASAVDLLGRGDGLHRRRRSPRHAFKNGFLLGLGWIAEADLHHEAVDLRLGQGVSSFLLDRILGGEDEEWVGQLVRFGADGDLVLLHRLEQGALHLGGSAVDFVGKDEVGEHGAFAGLEVAAFLIEY